MAALVYDLSTEKKVRIPTRAEDRERELQELVKKGKRPVALFVDDAHALIAGLWIFDCWLLQVIHELRAVVELQGKPVPTS
jgi:hypothetical protein